MRSLKEGKRNEQKRVMETPFSLSPASEAIKLLLRHIGIESCRLVPGYEVSSTISHGLPLVFLRQCCDLLDSARAEGDWGNCQAIVITLLVRGWEGGREGGREGGGRKGGRKRGGRERISASLSYKCSLRLCYLLS